MAYTPINQTIGDTQTSQKIEVKSIPPYPDKGVVYGGYSKTFLGNGEYKLSPQSQVDYTFAVTYTGGETSSNLARTTKDSKDFYCDKIIICFIQLGAVASIDTISIADGNALRLRLLGLGFAATTFVNYQIDFKTPIKFSKGNNMVISYSNARTAGDNLVINFFGWEEDQ